LIAGVVGQAATVLGMLTKSSGGWSSPTGDEAGPDALCAQRYDMDADVARGRGRTSDAE
jgi:hypothetical protein